MSTTPPPLPLSEHRLHRFSWLFLGLETIRQFLLPILGLLVFGNRLSDQWGHLELLLPLIVIGAVIISAQITQWTYRYSIGSTYLSVRSGLLERQWREIPFTRIHNINLHQNLVHRLFDVAELRLESAGSPKPEAHMKVLPLERALALEQLIRQNSRTQARSTDTAESVTTPDPHPLLPATAASTDQTASLLRLPIADLLRLGLLSNHGMWVVLAGVGALNQLIPEKNIKDLLRSQTNQWLDDGQRQSLQQLSLFEWIGTALVILTIALLLTRLLSVILAFVQYFGFELQRRGARLTQERGLFSRHRASVGSHRIQAWTITQPFIHSWFGLCRINVDIASGATSEKQQSGFRDLVPIIEREHGDALLQELAPSLHWPVDNWQPVGQRHYWRLMLPALLIPAACAVCHLYWSHWAWAGMGFLLMNAWSNWRKIRFAAWHLDARTVAIRGGSWGRWWRTAELSKVQSVCLQRTPLDRLCGTARLRLDTAGKSIGEPGLVLPFLPVSQAHLLVDQLCACLSRPRQ